MFSFIQHMHVRRWFDDSIDMASPSVLVLSQGGQLRPQRPQTERTKGRQTEQTGFRRHFYDGGQGLGGRTNIWSNYYRPHPGKTMLLCPVVCWYCLNKGVKQINIDRTASVLVVKLLSFHCPNY